MSEAAAELDVRLRLIATLDRVGAAAEQLQRAGRIPWDECHTIPLNPIASAAAGPLVDERWQPREKWAWQVLLITVTFAAGATGAIAYEATAAPGILPSNALHSFAPDALNMATWEPKGLLLLPNSGLAFAGVGGGITVTGRAVEIAVPRLPDYLL